MLQYTQAHARQAHKHTPTHKPTRQPITSMHNNKVTLDRIEQAIQRDKATSKS